LTWENPGDRAHNDFPLFAPVSARLAAQQNLKTCHKRFGSNTGYRSGGPTEFRCVRVRARARVRVLAVPKMETRARIMCVFIVSRAPHACAPTSTPCLDRSGGAVGVPQLVLVLPRTDIASPHSGALAEPLQRRVTASQKIPVQLIKTPAQLTKTPRPTDKSAA
jgi:hypothetical protein